MNNKFVGDNIRKVRRYRGLSQRELAEAVGYATKSSVNKIEAGKVAIPIPRLTKIAEVLRVPMQTFLSNDSAIDYVEAEIKADLSNEALELQRLVNAYCNASEEGKQMFRMLTDMYLERRCVHERAR